MKYMKFPALAFTLMLLMTALLFSANAPADSLEFQTGRLRLMESPELRQILREKFQQAQEIRARTMAQSEEDSLALQESGLQEIEQLMSEVLKVTWARPDQDGFRREMTELVQVELSAQPTSFPNVVAIVAGQSVGALQSKGLAVKDQETHYNILRNLIAEMRPQLKNSEAIKRVIEMIRDRDIRLSKELLSHLELNSMQKGRSPSDLAKEVLKGL